MQNLEIFAVLVAGFFAASMIFVVFTFPTETPPTSLADRLDAFVVEAYESQ